MCKCFIRRLKSEIEQRITRNLRNVQKTIMNRKRIPFDDRFTKENTSNKR